MPPVLNEEMSRCQAADSLINCSGIFPDMDAERWKRIEEVYYNVQASPLRRAAILDELCPHDPDIRNEVESLLNASEHAGNFLSVDDFTGYVAELASQPDLVGRTLGAYEVLDEI